MTPAEAVSDEDLLESSDFYEELMEKKGNYQCVFCGGWALFCPCKSNMFSKEEKEEVARYLQIKEKYENKK